MARKRKGRDVHGVLLLDKPPGMSSNQAVQRVRHLLGARKAGHTGSLDPFATGMLPLCLGEASKTAAFLLDASKTYLATARLGTATNTGDIEGEVIRTENVPNLSVLEIEEALASFSGRISQVPPMFSALKHQGQPLYKLAREGRTVERASREVTIHHIKLLDWNSPLLTFEVRCSKGTYIRTLAEDIAARLGTCGHLRSLRRLAVEPFDTGAMVGLDVLEQAVRAGGAEAMLLPLDAGLTSWPGVQLDAESAMRFRRGNPVSGGNSEGRVRVLGPDGRIIGLGEVRQHGVLHANRVFVFCADEEKERNSAISLVKPQVGG